MRASGVLTLVSSVALLLQSSVAGQAPGSSAGPAQSVDANEIECPVTTPNENRGPGATYRDGSGQVHGFPGTNQDIRANDIIAAMISGR